MTRAVPAMCDEVVVCLGLMMLGSPFLAGIVPLLPYQGALRRSSTACTLAESRYAELGLGSSCRGCDPGF